MHIRLPEGVSRGWVFVLAKSDDATPFVEEFLENLPQREIEKVYARIETLISMAPFDARTFSANFKKLTGLRDAFLAGRMGR